MRCDSIFLKGVAVRERREFGAKGSGFLKTLTFRMSLKPAGMLGENDLGLCCDVFFGFRIQ